MSLKDQAKNAFENFENTAPDEILSIIAQIKDNLQSPLTKEYLAEKIASAKSADSDEEKKKQCKKLTPYLDWYVQGH